MTETKQKRKPRSRRRIMCTCGKIFTTSSSKRHKCYKCVPKSPPKKTARKKAHRGRFSRTVSDFL